MKINVIPIVPVEDMALVQVRRADLVIPREGLYCQPIQTIYMSDLNILLEGNMRVKHISKFSYRTTSKNIRHRTRDMSDTAQKSTDQHTSVVICSHRAHAAGIALHDGRLAHTRKHEHGGGTGESFRVLHDMGHGFRSYRVRRRHGLPEAVQRLVARGMEEGQNWYSHILLEVYPSLGYHARNMGKFSL